MKMLLASALTISCFFMPTAQAAQTTVPKTDSLYSMTAQSLAGQTVPLDKYKGKLVMVVNVASKCGFTPQYKGLEQIYEKYKDRGFVILGFPSNDFHEQEPGSAEEIQKFCSMKYGVSFPLFKKDAVTGDAIQPVYKYLVANAPESEKGPVGWNFEKFLVGPDGKVIDRWRSKVTPESDRVTSAIEKNLPKVTAK